MNPNHIERAGGGGTHRKTGNVLDVVVTGVLSLVGVAVGFAGLGLAAVDRGAIAAVVDRFAVQSELFSGGELVELAAAVAYWSGVGAALTGALFVAVGVGFLLECVRGTDDTGTATNALYGAVVAAALSFVPGSPVLGGAAAGYLQGERGPRVGAAAGVVAAVPALLLVGFAFVGLTNGLATVGATAVAALVGVVGVVALLLVLAFSTALGAVGGALGERVDGVPF
jgi:hypothetical protein